MLRGATPLPEKEMVGLDTFFEGIMNKTPIAPKLLVLYSIYQ